MSRRTRQTLRKYFEKGRLPSQENFHDLIDSMLNIVDEGFDKTLEDGLKIHPMGESEKYISFFRKTESRSPIWSFNVDDGTGSFELKNRNEKTILSVSQNGRVGVNTDQPRCALDVRGVVGMNGRAGGIQGRVLANGLWQDILKGCEGCCAFEVMAGVGRKGEGKYSLLHAVVLSTFHSRDGIKSNTAWYGSRCNRLKLRWAGAEKKDAYSLQIKTCSDYGDSIRIRYGITSLWFDPFMEKSREKEKKMKAEG